MDIIFSEIGVESAFKDMRMLGRSLKCDSNKFLKNTALNMQHTIVV